MLSITSAVGLAGGRDMQHNATGNRGRCGMIGGHRSNGCATALVNLCEIGHPQIAIHI